MSEDGVSRFEPGTTVRIKTDPGQVGVVLKNERFIDDDLYQQVNFPNGARFCRPSTLEEVGGELEDPLELLSKGRFGRPKNLRGLLTHIRLSGKLANLIYSMETTNTDFYPYQFKPVLNFLDSPSGGLLVADEVGLGKTIEAGLIWTELRSRFDARKLLVVCPAAIRKKWQQELQYRFGIKAEIVNAAEAAERISAARSSGLGELHLIGSIEGLAPKKRWEDLRDQTDGRTRLARLLESAHDDEPLFDLVIIDEAHRMRNPETTRAALGRLLRGATGHILLLSATPVHLKNRDLYELLNLVDKATFDRPEVFDEVLVANEPLIRARELVFQGENARDELLDLLETAERHPFLKRNRQLAGVKEAVATESLADLGVRAKLANKLERLNLLGHAVNRTRKREVTEWRVIREAVAEEITMEPVERDFYIKVTELVRAYCAKRDAHEGFLLVTPQRQVSSSMAASLRDWQRRAERHIGRLGAHKLDEDAGTEQPGPLVGELLRHAQDLGDLEALYSCDGKYRRLVAMLGDYLSKHPNEKIILFSTFKATLRYLHERLEQDGISSTLLMGGMREDKHDAIARFRVMRCGGVLLASEVASEGVDLQFARVLINYDLPWNPMKVEQRIGRIDRLGQQSPKILIWNLMYADTIDARIYSRLFARLGIFERALGGLEAVLGDEIRKLTMDLMHGEVTARQEEVRIEQTAVAMANLRKLEVELENQAENLVAHGDYILRQVTAAREMNRWISGEDLCAYVLEFFEKYYPGCEFHQHAPDELRFRIRLSEDARFDLEQFVNRHRLKGQSKLAGRSSSAHDCEFKNKVFDVQSGKVEIISQFHPLVRFVGFSLREKGRHQPPCVSCRLSRMDAGDLISGDYVFAIDHWSLDGLRVVERVNYVVTRLSEPAVFLDEDAAELLITAAATSGSDWLAADSVLNLQASRRGAEKCLSRSITGYEQFVVDTTNENEDRAELQLASLEKYLRRRMEMLQGLLEGHRAKGSEKPARMTEGKIAKLKEDVAWKKRKIDSNRNIEHSRNDICVGVIRVE